MPPRARSNFDYTQTCIGDCGHVCSAWPVTGIHNFARGKREDWVFCEECTKEKYGLVDADGKLIVYVRLAAKNTHGPVEAELTGKPAAKRAPRKTAKKAVAKKINPWEQLVSKTVDTGGLT